MHDDVIKWKDFPRYWPFVRGTGNSPVPGEFPAQRPVTRGFDVFFDVRLNKRFSKQSLGWWFETPSHPLWRHCNDSSMTFISVPIIHKARQQYCGVLCANFQNDLGTNIVSWCSAILDFNLRLPDHYIASTPRRGPNTLNSDYSHKSLLFVYDEKTQFGLLVISYMCIQYLSTIVHTVRAMLCFGVVM